ncbi:MAG: hypothetical protein JSR36_16475 [Proteobacteria bacterium]|nr:hypothetical protein [Pseudomonadota bacterium]
MPPRGAQQASHSRTSPSSSRMLASYLTDIEQLLDEQRFEEALRDAGELPGIAVALSDPLLQSSGEEVGQWCERWVGADGAPASAVPTGAERVGGAPPLPVSLGSVAPSVPRLALRHLQLRRHTRTRPRGFMLRADESLEPRDTQSLQTVRALVSATRRWYARSGVHDPTVQSNLARLAVLR